MAADDVARAGLDRALLANRPGSSTPHTVVVLPSYSLGDSLLAHYAPRLPALEHRYLHTLLMLPRIPTCEVIFVTCLAPGAEVLDYYLSLMPASHRESVAARIHVVEVPDTSPRPVSHKLLDRPDLIARLRAMVAGRIAYIDPWNVTPAERQVADLLGLPLNGTAPELWSLGFKSAGRKLMRRAGVPLPYGHEDVGSVDDIVAAALDVAEHRPGAAGVVVKTDDSGAGDGNRVLRLVDGSPGRRAERLRAAAGALEPWYLGDVSRGAVVEELLDGTGFASPSGQLDIAPDGEVTVLSTHEQLLGGGPSGQVYVGCDFPARGAYSAKLASHGAAVGRSLARRGAVGRIGVDFVAVERRPGRWKVYGIEINLRKGGTTHPFSALCNLVPGHYDVSSGRWVAEDGSVRCYRATDNLADPAWRGRSPTDVVECVRAAGAAFDPASGTGVVLHMFSGLDVDGRLGLTAIGTSPAHARHLYAAAAAGLASPVAASATTA